MQSLEEAERVMIHGPIIEGFAETKDPKIPNEAVTNFLHDCFGEEELRNAKIARIAKDDKYLIQRRRGEKFIEEGNALAKTGLVRNEEGMLFLAEDREHYERAAMFLEGVDDPSKLKNTFKLRATAGISGGFHIIRLRSFGIEKSNDLDYLADVPLASEEDKMRAYMLGVLAHEVAHRIEGHLDKMVFTGYTDIMEEERAPSLRPQYVSAYVVRHKEVFESNEHIMFQEDFADSVRIYVTNPKYLEQNYPRRFAFIRDHFPAIKAGSVVEAVKNLDSGKLP